MLVGGAGSAFGRWADPDRRAVGAGEHPAAVRAGGDGQVHRRVQGATRRRRRARLGTQERPGQWLLEARADIEDVEQMTGLALLPEDLEDEVDTLGGLVVVLAGRVPAAGEIIQHPSGVVLEVVEANPRRVKRVRLKRPASE